MKLKIPSLILCALGVIFLLRANDDKTPHPTDKKINAAGQIEYVDYPEGASLNQIVIITKQVVVDYQCIPTPGNPPSGNIRVYCDSGTGQFTCRTSGGGACGGTASAVAFSGITSGTNSAAAMVVGTGSSLSASGTGSITATKAPEQLLSGVNVVTACGAPTDGVTDATSAFQNCLTNNPGARIIIPKTQPYISASPDYNFTSITKGCTLTMAGNGQWMDGETAGYSFGTGLQFATGASGICVYNQLPGSSTQCQGCRISNLFIMGNEMWTTATIANQILPLGLNGVATSGGAATITAISDAAGTVSVTTSAPHGLIVGQDVTISGTTSYNSTYQILTVPTTTTFTVATETSTAYASESSGTAQGLVTTSSSTADGIRDCADFTRMEHLHVMQFGRHAFNVDSTSCGREVGFVCIPASHCLADEGDFSIIVMHQNRGDGIYCAGADCNSNSLYDVTTNVNQVWGFHDNGFLGNKYINPSGQLNHVDQTSTPGTVNISSITGTSNVVSVTLASPLTLVVGQAVVIAGTTNYNGTFFVATVADTTHFTFGIAGNTATESTGTVRAAKATEAWTAAGIDGGHYKMVGASQTGVVVGPYAETGQPVSKFAGSNAIFGGNISAGGQLDFTNANASEYTARTWKGGGSYTFQRPTDAAMQLILQTGATAYSGASVVFANHANSNVWKMNGSSTTIYQLEDSANSSFPFLSYNSGFLALSSRAGNGLRLQNATGATGSVFFQNAGVTTTTVFNDGSIGTIETAAHAGIASSDVLYADSTAHRWKMNNNNGGAFLIPGVSAAGTSGHLATYASNGIDLVDGGAVPGGLSGLTTGFLVKAASSTTGANSLCDEGITTANTLTSSRASTAFVQISAVNQTTSTTKTSPFAAPAVTGIAQNDILVIWFGINSPIATTTVSAPTDTFGLTYSVIQAAKNSDNNANQIIGFCASVGLHSGSDTITFTWTAATLTPRIFIIEYSGASCTVDGSATSAAVSASCAAGPITTTSAGDLLTSFAYTTTTVTTWTAGGSWLLESSSSALSTGTADQQTAAVGSYTENISWTGSAHRICAIVALKKPFSVGSKLIGPSNTVGAGAII